MALAYVARHGETQWNRDGRYQGRLESSLTELGQRQARALAAALAPAAIERVVSSPLSRCTDTAAPLAHVLGLAVETNDDLLEIAHGTWEGRLRADLERDDARRIAAWRDAPESVCFDGGESLADVALRWERFAASLDGNKNVAVVTHDVVVRVALLWASARPLSDFWKPRVSNGGYAVFALRPRRWELLDTCRDAHLEGLLADASRQAL